MLTFECPLCKAKMQAADEYAGKSVVCPTCQRPATVPRGISSDAIVATPGGPLPVVTPIAGVTTPEVAAAHQAKSRRYGDDELDDERQRDNLSIAGGDRSSWMRVMIYGGVFVTVFVVLAALLVPATEKVREASARTQSINNLKQIGLAGHSFHDTFKRLPTNGVTEPTVAPDMIETPTAVSQDARSGSWLFKLLPYVDQTPLFNSIPVANVNIPAFMCPGRGRPQMVLANGICWADYAINPWINSPAGNVSALDKKLTLPDVTDGTSNTIFAGHGQMSTLSYAATAPMRACSSQITLGGTAGTARVLTMNQRDLSTTPAGTTSGWGSPFPQGCAMVLLDGTIRFFPYATHTGGVIADGKSTAPTNTTLGIFLTPTGGEAGQLPD